MVFPASLTGSGGIRTWAFDPVELRRVADGTSGKLLSPRVKAWARFGGERRKCRRILRQTIGQWGLNAHAFLTNVTGKGRLGFTVT